jgi:hypothetical protein
MSFKLVVKLEDHWGRKTKRSFDVDAVDFAAALAASSDFVTDYQAVTELAVYQWGLTQNTYISATPEGTANRDEGMTITAGLETPGKTASLQIPGPVRELRAPDGSIIIDDALMVALLANYTSSGPILISDGEVVNRWIKGKLDA